MSRGPALFLYRRLRPYVLREIRDLRRKIRAGTAYSFDTYLLESKQHELRDMRRLLQWERSVA